MENRENPFQIGPKFWGDVFFGSGDGLMKQIWKSFNPIPGEMYFIWRVIFLNRMETINYMLWSSVPLFELCGVSMSRNTLEVKIRC